MLANLYVTGVSIMSEAVLVALITGVCAVIGQWLISRKQAKERHDEELEREVRLDMRLQGVEKRLDTHNNYAEKITGIQTDIAVIKNDIKNLKESGSRA